MKFTGELKFPEIDHPGVPVQFVIDGVQVELVVEGESLGRWSLYDVHARRLVSNAFSVDLDGTEVTFLANDPIDFAYRGVEHMAETWAAMKAKRIGARSLAIRKSRRGTKPPRLDALREAMETNLEPPPPKPLAGEHSMPGQGETVLGAPAPDPDDDWDRRDADATIPSVAEVESVSEVPAAAVSAEPAAAEDNDAKLDAERRALEEEKRRIAEERARLEEERRAAEQREANLVEAFRLEMQRLEAEREQLRKEAEAREAAALAANEEARAEAMRLAEEARAEAAREAEIRAAEEEAARKAQEEAQRLAEEERLRREEEAAELARAEKELAEREEAERKAREEAERAATEEAERVARQAAEAESDEMPVAQESAAKVDGSQARGPAGGAPSVVDLKNLEDAKQEPAMAGAPKSGGLMGAVKAAFRGGSRDHEHKFVEAPGGIGIVRYVCEECGHVSISV